jgi:hypothetical protein
MNRQKTLAYWLDLFARALERKGFRTEASLVAAASLSLSERDVTVAEPPRPRWRRSCNQQRG